MEFQTGKDYKERHPCSIKRIRISSQQGDPFLQFDLEPETYFADRGFGGQSAERRQHPERLLMYLHEVQQIISALANDYYEALTFIQEQGLAVDFGKARKRHGDPQS